MSLWIDYRVIVALVNPAPVHQIEQALQGISRFWRERVGRIWFRGRFGLALCSASWALMAVCRAAAISRATVIEMALPGNKAAGGAPP